MPEKTKKGRVMFEWSSNGMPRIIPNLSSVAKTQKTYTNESSPVTTTLFISKIRYRPQK